MSSTVNAFSPDVRWEATPINLTRSLHQTSLDSRSPFFVLITSFKDGYQIVESSYFLVVSTESDKREKTLQAITVHLHISSDDIISFRLMETLSRTSSLCSKLNMALALKCKILIHIVEQKVIFSIKSPTEAVEKRLQKLFSLFPEE